MGREVVQEEGAQTGEHGYAAGVKGRGERED